MVCAQGNRSGSGSRNLEGPIVSSSIRSRYAWIDACAEKASAREISEAESGAWSIAVNIALASDSGCPTGTNGPHLPSSRTSRGPLGQSVLTTGVPQAMAWMSTFGMPSCVEANTNSRDLAMNAKGFTWNPGKSTRCATPSSWVSLTRLRLSIPSPRTTRRTSRCCATTAKARISVAWSFCGSRRPADRMTGAHFDRGTKDARRAHTPHQPDWATRPGYGWCAPGAKPLAGCVRGLPMSRRSL